MVSGCRISLNKLRYNWRHDSILANLMKKLENLINKQMVLYADLADYKSPTRVTGSLQRPNIVTVGINKAYVIELTVEFETQIRINTERRKKKEL